MSNLLDKSSIVLTPTAYDNSKVLCVKPSDGSGDFDFSRNSAATRVNAQGLVENVQILSSNLVQNGDFATDTAWVKVNATISGGTGNLNGTGVTSLLFQNILTNGKTYTATFTISNYNSLGSAKLINNNGAAIYTITSNGTFTITFTHSNASGNFIFRAISGAIYSIDNVSVIEITTDTNLPRINYEGFSYDGSGNVVPDSGCGSWLFEPQSTNLITQSELFSDSSWSTYGVETSVTFDASQANPSGSNGSYIIEGLGGLRRFGTIVPVTPNTDYMISFYVKNINATFLKLLMTNGTGSVVYTSQVNSTDWSRVEIDFTSGAGTSATIQFLRDLPIGESVYIWGVQVEEQSYATSYIPTSGSSVTRNQDLCTNGGSLASINSTEGTLYFEGAALFSGSNAQISLSDGTNDNGVKFRFDLSANRFTCFIRGNGGSTAAKTVISSPQTDNNKIALVWNATNLKIWINGVEAGTTATNDLPVGLDTLNFASNTGVLPFFGKTKALAVWKEALTDAELTALTTI